MIKRFTSIAIMAASCIFAFAQEVDLTPFRTLPKEEGKGVTTSLKNNNIWVAYKAAPGTNLGSATWAKFNAPWGGNGRVYLENHGKDANGNDTYIIAGQGRFIIDFGDDGRSIVGIKADAKAFSAVYDADGKLYFKDPVDDKFLIADNGNGNNILMKSETDATGWEVGTWLGVTFARLDVKPFDGDAGGVNIEKCADGYYYGTLYLPFATKVPNGNTLPNQEHGDKAVKVWKLGGFADAIEVTELNPGDDVPAGTPILVRATAMNVDFPIVPTSEYVDQPAEEGFFTGYYTVAPEGEHFQLRINDGYPKFGRAAIITDPESPNVIRQAAVNLGYILSNNDNEDIYEYRFDFEKNTLTGYENPDYKKLLENKYSELLNNPGTAFGIDPVAAEEIKAEIAALDDPTEEEYEAIIEKISNSTYYPDDVYTAIKNNGFAGDRAEASRKGLYANFGTPNGANGRAYLKKANESGSQYYLGFNGRYVQAPVVGEQPTLGTDPVPFDLTVTESGKFTLAYGDVALVDAGDQMQGGNLYVKDEDGNDVEDDEGNKTINSTAIWTVDNNYTGIVRADAKVDLTGVTGLRYGTVTMPYDVKADKERDAEARLFLLQYDADDNLVLNEVETLKAGTPGIVAGSSNSIVLNILGGYATAPVSDVDNALIGIMNESNKPAEGEYKYPHFLAAGTKTVNNDEGDEVIGTSESCLVMSTAGGYDVNMAFHNGGENADDIEILNFKDVVTGIESVQTPAIKKASNAIYNMAGQRVGADYKGIVIKNGKKYINK